MTQKGCKMNFGWRSEEEDVVEQIIQDGQRKPGNVKRFPVT